MQPTHFIVEMKAGLTKGSQSPMWRCTTQDGERVNVFKHTDPVKNSYRHFEAAGYGEMTALKPDEIMTWKLNPIGIVMTKKGDWWEIVAVESRPDGAKPDPVYTPDLAWYRRKASQYAAILQSEPCMYLDTETTGLGADAEIISIAVVSADGEIALNTRLRPRNMDAVAATFPVHGLSPDDLANAPALTDEIDTPYTPFQERRLTVADYLNRLLYHREWVIYNAEYDTRIIDQSLMMYGLEPLIPRGVHCAMKIYSEYAGAWDAPNQRFKSIKLAEAAAALGIDPGQSHDAVADTLTTYQLIKKMAVGVPEIE